MDYEQWLKKNSNSQYILKEAALLFEAGTNQKLDSVIVVSAPEELRISRVLQRDTQRTKQQVEDIIRNQMSETEKLKRADYIIVNDESRLVIPQILELHKKLLEKSAIRSEA
jgi:dephospho-CoA kinase